MTELLFARAQMGLSLAFHIVFAAAGVALPVLMVQSDLAFRRTGDADYQRLSHKLAKGAAILFAVGAVSGTVLSFELGLLWPRFMGAFGAAVGLPFSCEAFAFFTEAIFLGIYLYGRERVSPNLHLFSGIAVAVSGAASAVFVVLVNAFMNHPDGYARAADGALQVEPLKAMFTPGWQYEALHTLVASYQAAAFAMAGLHALLLRKGGRFQAKALGVALPLAILTSLLQPVLGDLSARHVAHAQPAKLAAMEAHFHTSEGAPLLVGGFPDEATQTVPYALELPRGLSLLAFEDPSARVTGLDAFPRDEWPPVGKTHAAFDVMVGTGSLMALLSVVTLVTWLRSRNHGGLFATPRPWLWRAWTCSGPLGVIALEAGWLVTEYGRQPWVVHGLLRTADAVTTAGNLWRPFVAFGLVYLGLALIVSVLLLRQVRGTLEPESEGEHAAHV